MKRKTNYPTELLTIGLALAAADGLLLLFFYTT